MVCFSFRALRKLGFKRSLPGLGRLRSPVCYRGNLYLFEHPSPLPTEHTPLISHKFLETIWKVMTRTVHSWNGLVSKEVGGLRRDDSGAEQAHSISMMPQTSTLPNPVSSRLLKAERIKICSPSPTHRRLPCWGTAGSQEASRQPSACCRGDNSSSRTGRKRERNKDAQGSVAFWDGRELIVQPYFAPSGNSGHFFHKMLISIDFMWKSTLAFCPFSL